MMKNYEEDDRDFIMVTVPRVLNFELMVLDFAIKLLIEWAKLPENKYFMESSVSQDQEKLKQLEQEGQDYKLITVLAYNLQLKKTLQNAIKMLRVAVEILKLHMAEKEPMTSATFRKIKGLEDNDTFEEIYLRRMGMKEYF